VRRTPSAREHTPLGKCDAVLSSNGDLDETVTVCEAIETTIAQGSPQRRVSIAGHDYAWSLGPTVG